MAVDGSAKRNVDWDYNDTAKGKWERWLNIIESVKTTQQMLYAGNVISVFLTNIKEE